MTTVPVPALSPSQRRRRLTVGLLRSFAITVIFVAGYYLLPLDRLSSVPMGLILGLGLLALAVFASYQVSAVIRSRYPALKAVDALAVTVNVTPKATINRTNMERLLAIASFFIPASPCVCAVPSEATRGEPIRFSPTLLLPIPSSRPAP